MLNLTLPMSPLWSSYWHVSTTSPAFASPVHTTREAWAVSVRHSSGSLSVYSVSPTNTALVRPLR
ncbi:hypothetical protein [Streptomyces tendae]|uniref:hypothetical protein n=1 Tax=Streptomyces tendae TaxID=1932 RepID=UPI0036F51532